MSREATLASESSSRPGQSDPAGAEFAPIDLRKIKLIVWDLDETLWQGTLSEEGVVPIDVNNRLIVDLSKRGIVNSVCSKNDMEPAMAKLTEIGLSDYFVFNSIDWSPKGERIKAIVDNMSLRYENVLFIDDNISNLKESEFYCPGLMVALPSIIEDLKTAVGGLGKDDSALERLQQYRQLEEKHVKKSAFSSNQDFLVDSAIRVEFHDDVLANIDRLHEVILRTNQLNFTKRRDSLEDFHALLESPEIDSGYVTVSDKYGEYGIVGFYAVKDQSLIHFAFSCRTMGMGVEQFVFHELGSPAIEIVGPVSGTLVPGERPAWINRDGAARESTKSDTIEANVIFKGPCDMQSIVQLVHASDIATELVHVDDHGRQIEIQCATQNIVNAGLLTTDQRQYLRNVMPFYEDEVFETTIFDDAYDVIVMSILADFNFGVYENSVRGIKVALGQNYQDITDPKNWPDYISGRIYNGNYTLTRDQLEKFAAEFTKVAHGVEAIIANVRLLRQRIKPHTKLVMTVGSERNIEKYDVGNYKGRADFHKQVNDALRSEFAGDASVVLIEPDKYISGPEDYIDHINHYSKRVMFNLANEITAILSDQGVNVRTRSSAEVFANKLFSKIRQKLPRSARRA